MSPAFSKMGVWNQRTTAGCRKEIFVMFHSTPSWENVESILDHGFAWSDPSNMLGHGIYVSSTLQKAVAYGGFTLKLLVYPYSSNFSPSLWICYSAEQVRKDRLTVMTK